MKLWDSVKREEKKHKKEHYLAGVAAALPALMRAQKIQKKAAHVHFDWTEVSDVVAKVDEELAETKEALASGDSERRRGGDRRSAFRGRESRAQAQITMRRRCCKRRPTSSCAASMRWKTKLRAQGNKLGEVGLAELDEIWNAQKAKTRA